MIRFVKVIKIQNVCLIFVRQWCMRFKHTPTWTYN